MASRDLKGLTIEIGGDTSDLASALRDVDSELSNLQSNLRSVNSALRLDPGNVDALAQRQSLLTDAVEETTRRLETLREAQRQLDQQIENGVDVDQRAYRNLQSEIIRAEASLADYERQAREAGDTSRNAGNESSNAADDTADGWTIAKDVISDLASEALQAVIEGFKDLLFESEKALDLLQAKIGASDDAMRKYGDVAKDVFNNGWGESLADVTEAIGTITNMLGDLDEVELKNVTEAAMTLSDVYGWDVKESIRAANSLMNQFGITSDEAFNLMIQGAQNGLDQNDDLLDTINEYSVQFKDAGYDANDMFNMLVNGAKTGTWSVDKLGDAIKEMNIRVSDGTADAAFEELGLGIKEVVGDAAQMSDEYWAMTEAQKKYNAAVAEYGEDSKQARDAQEKLSKAQSDYNEIANTTYVNLDEIKAAFAAGGDEAQGAMKQVMEALSNVEDDTKRYQLGVQIFGTMWEDLGENAVQSLLNTEGAITATNDALGQVKSDAYDNLATSVTTLGRTMKSSILDPIVEDIEPVIKGLVDWAVENMDDIAPLISGVAVALGVVTAAIIAAKIATIALTAAMSVNPIFLIATLIIAGIMGIAAAISSLAKASDVSGPKIKANAEAVTAFSDALADSKPNIIDATKVLSAYGRTVGDIDGIIAETENSITSILSTAMAEQRQLRDDELASIAEYNEKLEALQEEKLGVYRQAMTVELMKITAESQTMSQEQMAQYITNLQEALEQAQEVSTDRYDAQLAQIYNFHQTQGTLNSEAYQKDVAMAQEAYNQELADSQAFYNEGLSQLQAHANQWISVDAEKWAAVLANTDTSKKKYKAALAEIDLDNANAFLQMYLTTVKTGGEITDETATIAADMIASFDGLPKSMQEAGKDALLGMIKGLDDEIPALEDASEMTAQEIVDTLKAELQIQSPSRVTRAIGANVSEGLQGGMNDKRSLVSQAATGIATTVLNGLKSKNGEMPGIGKNMVEGVESGMQSKKSWIGSRISSFAGGLVSKFKQAFMIQSPSKIMRDEIGAMLTAGIGEGIIENEDAALDPIETLKNDLASFDGVNVNKNIGLNVDSTRTEIRRLSAQMDGISSILGEFLPYLAKKTGVYVDGKRLVGELAPDIDEALGEIANRRAVGAV